MSTPVQATKTGENAIMHHRKAFVQLCARDLAPVSAEALNMRDYVKSCGGDVFANVMGQLVEDDQGLSKWVKILSMGTVFRGCEAAHGISRR